MKLDFVSESILNKEKFCFNRRYYKEEVVEKLCYMLQRALRDKI